MWWWVIGVIAVFCGAALALSEVLDWLDDNKTAASDYGELVKERLESGDYRVVAGIFNHRGVCTASQAWEADELEDDLREQFGRRYRIRVEL